MDDLIVPYNNVTASRFSTLNVQPSTYVILAEHRVFYAVLTGKYLLPVGRTYFSTQKYLLPVGRTYFSTQKCLLPVGRTYFSTQKCLLPTGRTYFSTQKCLLPTGRTYIWLEKPLLPVFWAWFYLAGEENTTANTLPESRADKAPYAFYTGINLFHIFYKISAKIVLFLRTWTFRQ
jgi:hypothetical protein